MHFTSGAGPGPSQPTSIRDPIVNAACSRIVWRERMNYAASLSSAFKIAAVIALVLTFVIPFCMMSGVR